MTPAVVLAAALAWPQLTAIKPFALHSGANLLPAFAPDGREGLVVVGAPNTQTASGAYTAYMVLLRRAKPDHGWSLARFATGDEAHSQSPWENTIIDVPHTGEDQIKSVRFARARVNGRAETVIVTARRDLDEVETIPDAAHVDFTLLQLVLDPAFEEETFEVTGHLRSKDCFSNSDAALKAELGLPPPAGFDGDAKAAPCPAPKGR